MAAVTIPCPNCGKTHKAAGFEEASAKCLERAEKRAAKEAAKQADVERRQMNAYKEAPMKFVQRLVVEGVRWDSIRKQLSDDYPPPAEGEKWTIYDVIRLDSQKLVSTWPTDVDTITMLRLEKLMTGDFMSMHPLALPADGSFHLGAEGGRQLEIPWTDQQLQDADKRRRADEKAAKAAAKAAA